MYSYMTVSHALLPSYKVPRQTLAMPTLHDVRTLPNLAQLSSSWLKRMCYWNDVKAKEDLLAIFAQCDETWISYIAGAVLSDGGPLSRWRPSLNWTRFPCLIFHNNVFALQLITSWYSSVSIVPWSLTERPEDRRKIQTQRRDSWRIKDQLDVTCYFISLLMSSTCFGH